MNDKENQSSKKKALNSYIKYTTLGFQMLGAVLIGYFLGSWLDKKFPLMDDGTPVLTAVFSLLFSCIAIYLLIKQVTKEQ